MNMDTTPKRIGRPLMGTQPLCARCIVRLTEPDLDLIERQAKVRGRKVATWVRELILIGLRNLP